MRNGAVPFRIDGRRIDLVGLVHSLLFAREIRTGIGDLNSIDVVRIESEDRNAAVRKHLTSVDVILDLRAVLLRHDADLNVGKRITA